MHPLAAGWASDATAAMRTAAFDLHTAQAAFENGALTTTLSSTMPATFRASSVACTTTTAIFAPFVAIAVVFPIGSWDSKLLPHGLAGAALSTGVLASDIAVHIAIVV